MFIISIILQVAFNSCTQTEYRYIDLATGKRVYILTDSTGVAIDSISGKPVYIYYDTQTKDTIYGKTGKVINNHLVRTTSGGYDYVAPAMEYSPDTIHSTQVKHKSAEQHDLEMLNKYGKYKRKSSSNGDVKIVEGDKKIKVDGETGVKTVKDK